MQSSSTTKPTSEGSSPSAGLLPRWLISPLRRLDPARRSRHGSESGQALVEFALVLPLLLILLLLIFDFGRAINYWIDTTHLASEGARLAAVDKAPGGSLQTHIKDQADTEELRTGGSVGVLPPGLEVCVEYPEGRAVGQPVEVTVRAQYNWLPFIDNEFGLTEGTIKGTATHRIERVTGAVDPGCDS